MIDLLALIGCLLQCTGNRRAKEDFELSGKLVREGTLILADLLYAKAGDTRVSAGDHVDHALPVHMDIHRLNESFKPERWLDESNKLDTSVRFFIPLNFSGLDRISF